MNKTKSLTATITNRAISEGMMWVNNKNIVATIIKHKVIPIIFLACNVCLFIK